MKRFIQSLGKQKGQQIRTWLSIVYAIIAWNGVLVAFYVANKTVEEKTDLPLGLRKAASTKYAESTTVYHFEGFKLVNKEHYNKEEIQQAREKLKNLPAAPLPEEVPPTDDVPEYN